MIQHIQIDCNTRDAITQAARDDGMEMTKWTQA